MSPSVPRAHPVALAALAYVAFTLAYTWPLPIRLTSGIIHDPYDPILNTWILQWSTKAVPLTQAWWNAPIFLPAPGVLAFSEHLLGLFPIAAPLIALTGKPLLGYNVALAATYPLSALAAYFLAFTLTRRHDAAFVAGLAYGFAPYRLGQLPHIQTLTAYWTPICLAALHRYHDGGGPLPRRSFNKAGWVVLAAVAFLMQALSSGYYMFFLAVLLALWFLWFAAGRWPARMWATAGAAFGVAALVLLPILLGYQNVLRDVYGFTRALGEIRLFSADAAGLLLASEDLLLWSWLHVIQKPESGLFPGLTIVLLSAFAIYRARPFAAGERSRGHRIVTLTLLAAVVLLLIAAAIPVVYGRWRLTVGGLRVLSIAQADMPFTLAVIAGIGLMLMLPRVRSALSRRSLLAFYMIAAITTWSLALGPEPELFGRTGLSRAPYGALMWLPGFDGLRVPARFWTMTLVCLSVIAALAVNRVPPARRRAVVVLAGAGLLLDGWPRTFPVLPSPALRPSPAGVMARLELPITDDIDTQAIYRQMFDGVPLHNGYSGYIAPHYYALRTLIDEREPLVLHELARKGPLGVVVDHAGDPDGGLRRFVMAYPGAQAVHSEEGWSSYRLPQSTAPPDLPDRTGTPLRIASLTVFPSQPHAGRALDGDLTTRWSGGVQHQSADATIDLGEPQRVGQVVIDLGGFVTDFATRLRIQVSGDARVWQTIFLGPTALHAYFGAVRHPREAPLVFSVNRDGIRYIRLQQTGFGRRDWSIPELHVLR